MLSNQEHATILRQMAGDEQCAAQYSRFLATRGTQDEAIKHEADAEGFLVKSAALLAGAEALEAIEAYIEHISSNWDTEDEAYRKFRAALARLEGK